MSYDLMVFNPDSAPKSEPKCLEWYYQQTEWTESHNYDDPTVSSAELRNWFMDITTEFPELNGIHAPDNIEQKINDDTFTDYAIGKDVIYSSFSWSLAGKAYPKVLELAKKHKVGFYDASGNGNIMFPNGNGELKSINKNQESKPWWKFW